MLLNVFGIILLGLALEFHPVVHRMKQFEKLVAGELEGEVMHEEGGVLCLSCKVVWGRKRLKNIWFNLFILPSVTICWALISCCETLPVSAGQTTAITFHEKLQVHTEAFVVCWDKTGTFQRCCAIEG